LAVRTDQASWNSESGGNPLGGTLTRGTEVLELVLAGLDGRLSIQVLEEDLAQTGLG
jgi:hypothetical protein